MSNQHITFFIPVEINALPEYLSSGFIGLLSSRDENITDKQSLIFPSTLGLKSLNSVNTPVCLEVSISSEQCLADSNLIQIKSPIPISRISKIVFFDEEIKSNFLASFSPFKEIPIDFFNYEVVCRSVENECYIDINDIRVRKHRSNFQPHVLHSLVVAIVNSSSWINQKVDFHLEVKIPKSKIKKNEIIKSQINNFLKSGKVLPLLHEHSFSFLNLYLEACDSLANNYAKPDPNNILTAMQSLSDDFLEGDEEKIYISKLIEKMQLILIGMDALPDLDDNREDLILQRGIVLAIILNGYNSLNSYRQNQKTGTIVESIARLLYISSNKISFLPEKIWKISKESFFLYLNIVDDILTNKALTIKVEKTYNMNDFDATQTISINNCKLLDSIIRPSHEMEHAINRLRSLRYVPKRYSKRKIFIEKGLLNQPLQKLYIEPISLDFTLPRMHFKDNFKISCILTDFANLLKKQKTRSEFIRMADKYMLSFSISLESHNDIEISRYQLSSTMDKDELEQHIELISIAAFDIKKHFL